jgi:hypothetical protein
VKSLNRILALTALLGWLPPLLCLLLIQLALPEAARWSEWTFGLVFVGLYACFLGAGAYAYTRWFS